MTEAFLHFIWRYGLHGRLRTVTGDAEPVEVVSRGRMNTDAGPDFFNAKVRIGRNLLAGNVEVHINSSDWYRHGHNVDRAYDTVVLQLVHNYDREVFRRNGEVVPTAVISFDSRLLEVYNQIGSKEGKWIPCGDMIRNIEPGISSAWLSDLAELRLVQKSDAIRNALHLNKNDGEETFYQLLARNFGFSLNGDAFHMLARSLPLKLLLKHRDSPVQTEAMLFGQAGMLETVGHDINDGDRYVRELKREYSFLSGKYGLVPLDKSIWRFLRLRPANFPTIRVAQFATLIRKVFPILSVILDTPDVTSLRELFRVSASSYWDTHYRFKKPSARSVKSTGAAATLSLVINSAVPVIYFYGRRKGMAAQRNRAISFLKALPAENNSITAGWKRLGVPVCNAFYSQALIHLKNEYCASGRCLDCSTGTRIMALK